MSTHNFIYPHRSRCLDILNYYSEVIRIDNTMMQQPHKKISATINISLHGFGSGFRQDLLLHFTCSIITFCFAHLSSGSASFST